MHLKGEVKDLNEEELAKRRESLAELFKISSMKCSLLCKKARLKWLKEGDANSKFFHGCINRRKRGNQILCLKVNANSVEGVEHLKTNIKMHFENQFRCQVRERQVLENLEFSSLNEECGGELIGPFSEK